MMGETCPKVTLVEIGKVRHLQMTQRWEKQELDNTVDNTVRIQKDFRPDHGVKSIKMKFNRVKCNVLHLGSKKSAS